MKHEHTLITFDPSLCHFQNSHRHFLSFSHSLSLSHTLSRSLTLSHTLSRSLIYTWEERDAWSFFFSHISGIWHKKERRRKKLDHAQVNGAASDGRKTFRRSDVSPGAAVTLLLCWTSRSSSCQSAKRFLGKWRGAQVNNEKSKFDSRKKYFYLENWIFIVCEETAQYPPSVIKLFVT